jgi:hypothetical protein
MNLVALAVCLIAQASFHPFFIIIAGHIKDFCTYLYI